MVSDPAADSRTQHTLFFSSFLIVSSNSNSNKRTHAHINSIFLLVQNSISKHPAHFYFLFFFFLSGFSSSSSTHARIHACIQLVLSSVRLKNSRTQLTSVCVCAFFLFWFESKTHVCTHLIVFLVFGFSTCTHTPEHHICSFSRSFLSSKHAYTLVSLGLEQPTQARTQTLRSGS